jgi:ribosomal protein S18 acetylase RimI-like enzyme
MDAIALRPATAADVDFCFHVHKASFSPYVAQVWGWDDDFQRAIHARNFSPPHVQIVTADGVDVGRLDIDDLGDELFIVLIELLPSHQGRGIGAGIIRNLLDRAAAQGKRVSLNVLEVNTRAYQLYRRLGFAETARIVEGPAVKIRMICGS